MGSYHPSRWASRLEVSPLFCRASHRLSTNRLHGEMLEPRAVPSFGVAGLAAPETSNATSVAAVNPTPGNSSLSGNVYLDLNDNGVFDSGESGIDGVTVTLTGTDRNGFFVQVSQVTDANGRFQFLGLNPGVYQIEQIQPAGYVDRWDRVGSLGGITENDRFVQIVVEPGQAGEGYDFGERPAGDS
ncbi:MAG: SpaA isopeptide-forming pilin-related protein, partial [Gemmataceae bacterium]|nr:SpaA isopeptide-forming pilin-related protein [Gemmataceae bacterium]